MAMLEASRLLPGIGRALKAAGWNPDDGLRPAGTAGSGRSYWRAHLDHGSLIVQINPTHHPDTDRFVDTSRALWSMGLPVARIHARDADQVLMDDLGNQRLWDAVEADGHDVPELKQAVVLIRRIQAVDRELFQLIPWLQEREFDKEHLLWETEYFRDNCWIKRMSPVKAAQETFETARTELAQRVMVHPQTFVHRDYQSQNLMIDGDQLAMVDHQGARIGSIFYDLASIAFDPYLELPPKVVRQMFELYCGNHPINTDEEAAWRDFLDAAAQRVMQANGAYGFLTQVKGIKSFERWRSPGWRRLQLVLDWHAEAWGADVLSKPIRDK